MIIVLIAFIYGYLLQSSKPEIISIYRRLDTLEHSHRDLEGNTQTLTNHVADLSLSHTATDTRLRQAEEKTKEDEQTVRDLTARVALLPTTEDVASVRRDLNEKVCFVCFALCSLFSFLFLSCFAYVFMLYICLCLRFVANYKKVCSKMKKVCRRRLLNMSNVSIMFVSI